MDTFGKRIPWLAKQAGNCGLIEPEKCSYAPSYERFNF